MGERTIGDTNITEVDRATFESALKAEEMQDILKLLEIDGKAAVEFDLFGLIEEDESESLDLDEIIGTMMKMIGPARALDVARVHRDVIVTVQHVQELQKLVAKEFKDLAKVNEKAELERHELRAL